MEILRRIVLPTEEHPADPDPSVRTAAARALGRIGGPEAVAILQKLAIGDPNEETRSAAVSSLASLALQEARTKGQVPSIPSGIRTRGAVRTRGASPLRSLTEEAGKILELLDQVRGTDPSWYVREKADEALSDLGE